MLAAAFESLVAAIYLDGGMAAAERFILDHVDAEIEAAVSSEFGGNFKSLLQQLAQREHGVTPSYLLLDEKGPDHSKCFKVAAQIGATPLRRGVGQEQEGIRAARRPQRDQPAPRRAGAVSVRRNRRPRPPTETRNRFVNSARPYTPYPTRSRRSFRCGIAMQSPSMLAALLVARAASCSPRRRRRLPSWPSILPDDANAVIVVNAAALYASPLGQTRRLEGRNTPTLSRRRR